MGPIHVAPQVTAIVPPLRGLDRHLSLESLALVLVDDDQPATQEVAQLTSA